MTETYRIDTETVVHSDNDFATVAYLRIRNAILIPKAEMRSVEPQIPPLLEIDFREVSDRVSQSLRSGRKLVRQGVHDANLERNVKFEAISRRVGRWVAVSNVQCNNVSGTQELSLEDEVKVCFENLKGISTNFSASSASSG